MAKESSKLLLFAGIVFSPLFQKRVGEGGAALEHAAGRLNGIIRDRLDGHLSLAGQGDQDLGPWPKADPLPKLDRDHDLPFRRSFHDRHLRSPRSRHVEHPLRQFNQAEIGGQARSARPLHPSSGTADKEWTGPGCRRQIHAPDHGSFTIRGLVERTQAVKAVASDLRWVDWQRYSARQEETMLMGGFLGTATFEGPIAEFLPILRLGEWLHVGKGTVFGLGLYRLGMPAQSNASPCMCSRLVVEASGRSA